MMKDENPLAVAVVAVLLTAVVAIPAIFIYFFVK